MSGFLLKNKKFGLYLDSCDQIPQRDVQFERIDDANITGEGVQMLCLKELSEGSTSQLWTENKFELRNGNWAQVVTGQSFRLVNRNHCAVDAESNGDYTSPHRIIPWHLHAHKKRENQTWIWHPKEGSDNEGFLEIQWEPFRGWRLAGDNDCSVYVEGRDATGECQTTIVKDKDDDDDAQTWIFESKPDTAKPWLNFINKRHHDAGDEKMFLAYLGEGTTAEPATPMVIVDKSQAQVFEWSTIDQIGAQRLCTLLEGKTISVDVEANSNVYVNKVAEDGKRRNRCIGWPVHEHSRDENQVWIFNDSLDGAEDGWGFMECDFRAEGGMKWYLRCTDAENDADLQADDGIEDLDCGTICVEMHENELQSLSPISMKRFLWKIEA